MTIDPIIVTAAIALLAAMGGLLLQMYRSFLNGSLHPRTTVPREDYEAVVELAAGYADRFGEQTTAVQGIARTMEGLVARLPFKDPS